MSIQVTFPIAGHHERDSGAVYNGRQENKETIKIRETLALSLQKIGIKVIKDKDNQTLSEVLRTIKPGRGSVLYDIHLNASTNATATGTECVVSNESYANRDNSYRMAEEICEVASKLLGIRNRGVIPESKTARKRLAILHTKAGISVVHEWCFISNSNDMKALDENMSRACEAIARILKKYDDLIT
ncbi:N-acetylmuramoyl-L-alanine amidase [Riemerella anatipestifer]|uniref:N-acetylmuramoyl-L-alanine amidase n=1 Tax=Riemerella anatipestifer TaxID=34085 RepID=UPI00129E81A7|nr:N-acetylmuramoyl-L-alanine amidase [Riemerella anatipestifer]MRM94595.1 N-acetylmuramoyl-L-alanine amidase [Riemerella anatipestifer]